MTSRVGVQFDGNAAGALNAGRQTVGAIRSVRTEAGAAGPSLRGLETNLGRVERGALAGTGALHGMGRAALYLSTTYIGAFGVGALLKSASDTLVDQVRVGARLGAVLRSTGGIAGETAGSINRLAKAEMAKTGVDSTQIKSAEVMLLRYSNVRDVVGDGNNIFKRATVSALDLAAALGGTAADQAATLGKALQDPYKGVTLLRRANVALTASEVENIKTLAQHGKVLEAQKAILDAVNRSYGGTAKAVGDASPWTKLSNTLKAMSATAIRPLLPEMDSITKRAQKWADGFESDAQAQTKLKATILDTVSTVKQFAQGANDVVGVLGGWRQSVELLLALKFVSVMSGWVAALRAFAVAEGFGTAATVASTEAVVANTIAWRAEAGALVAVVPPAAAAGAALSGAGAAAATASGEVGLLNRRIGVLRLLTSKPIQLLIAYEIVKKLTGSNADLSNDTSNADLLPVYKNGKWVNPITEVPVQDQAYWNRRFRQSGGSGKPLEGQQSSGVVTKSGAPPSSYGQRVKGQTAGLTALQAALPGAKGSNEINFPGHAAKSYHYSGEALDIGDGGNPAALISDWNYLYPLRQNFAELIWNPPADVQAMAPGSGAGYFWGLPGKFSDHTDHIHVAFTGSAADVAKLRAAVEHAKKTKTGAAPPTSGSGQDGSTNILPSRIRQSIAAANVAVAAAALTPGKADDKAAIAESKQAIAAEIAWIRAKLATNVGAEKRITLEDLLTGALGDLAGLTPAGKKKAGASISTITSLRASVNATLRDLPATLDDVERQAVSKLTTLRDHLKVGMKAKDLADTRASIRRWGVVLSDEISKQAKIAGDAATSAAAAWQRGWQNDVNRVLRDFQENVVNRQLDQFDRDTAAHLQGLQDKYGAKTLEEQALASFDAANAAADEAKQRADIAQQIVDTQAQLDALGTGSSGTLIDIATGQRTPIAGTDLVSQRKTLLDQLQSLNDQNAQLDRQDQRAALQAVADLSRTAADKKLAADQADYQAGRDALRQSLGDNLQDQQTALQQSLDDWQTNIEAKKQSWREFIQWLKEHGYSTVGITDPNPQTAPVGLVGAAASAAIAGRLFGQAQGFATGGRVPGPFYGRQDTVMARLTPTEEVLDTSLSSDLRAFLNGGRGGGPTVTIVELNGREIVRQTSQPMTSEQARQIGYTMQRG